MTDPAHPKSHSRAIYPMNTQKDPKPSRVINTPPQLDPTYAKFTAPSNSPNNVLMSPMTSNHSPIDNLLTINPPSNSVQEISQRNTLKNLKKNIVVDIKPFARARSLNTNTDASKINKTDYVPEDMTKTKLYLNKIANLFKKNNSEQAVLKQPSRKSIRSKTSNKIYPEMIDEPLYTVDDEDEDRYDIDMFDQEIMMENRIKTKSREEKKHLYEKVLHLIKHEEEDYVYQNNNDSEEENEENDKKFKLIDSGLMYEKELEKVSNAEAFYSLFAEKKNAFEMNRMYSDSYPCLDLRKKLMYVKCLISHFCYIIISSKAFEAVSLLVIIWNTIMLMIDPNSTSDLSDTFDPMFLYLYTVEMGLKILALGFILNEGSYLRDYWNILDFTIISTGYLPLIMGSDSSVNLSSLRSLRVLRPLRTISRIKALKTILVTLFSAMPLILSSVMVNLFFLLIFAIAGLQLFSGLLKKRCFHSFTGVALQQPVDNIDVTIKGVICGYESCPNDYTCGRMIENPNFDLINFDTIFYSFLMIFQCITLEGWTNIMYLVVKSFSIFTTLFFIILVWIGAYFLVNLTLAVISTKFKEAQEKKNENKELIGDDDEDEEEKITGPSVVDIRNLKLCEKSHHKRSLRSLANTNLYGANEEIFKKKELEVRWDDLFELKERIREERERLESEENFIKVRDQELEGSNYKIHHRKKKNDLRYLPKANPHTGKTPLIMQKIFHKSKKLRFVGIQGVNLEKKKHKNRKSVISIKETNNFEQSLDKSKGETFKLINIDEEEAFFQESSKKAENFQETNPDLYNISSILKKPKTFHKAPSNFLEDQKEKSIRSIQKIQNPTMNSFNMMKEEKSEKDPKIMYRQRTFEHKNLNSSSKEKKLDIKIKRSSLQMDTKNFFESKQKLKNFIKKPSFMDSNQTNFNNHRVFQRRISRKISRKITHLSFNSHSDHSNLESTILNDSDFNIGGFEKSEKKKLSLTLIPIENSLLKNDTSPFTRNAGILHPLIAGNRLKNVITQTIEKKNEKSINSSKILKRDSSIEAEVLSQQNLKISPVEDNTRISKNTDLLNFESDIIDKNDNISDNNKQAEENSRLEQPSQAELTYKISDPKLIDEMKAQKPASFLKNGVINNAANHMYKVIAENKIMNKIFPVAAFIQTDPENNNNAYDTDQENGQPKNFSEQASTRTFIETKNTLDQKEKGGSRLLRAFTSFRRRKLKVEKKKEDIERIKRLQIQKKFNVLHYKLMIYVDKIYESNSMDDVLVSYNETLKKAKKEAFEKEIKSVRHMPIYYIPKVLNIKKIDKKRKKQERKLLRDMEKKRHDLIDFQTLTSENILKKILKISTTSPMMPVRFHKNLLAILNKQRSALFGERESRMKASSVTSPLLSRGSKTNISMNFSQRSKNTILINKKKKKNTEIQIKFDYETLKETIKEKLYDKHAVVEQMEEFAYDQIYEEIWLTDFNNHMKNDFYRNIKINLRWSGDDVYDFQDAYNKKFNESSSKDLFSLFKLEKIQKRINRLMNSISSISYQKDVWLLGFKGKLILAQKYLRYCVNSKYFDNSMLFCVIFNTVILAMDGLFYDPDTVELFSNFNQSLTMIFSVEMALKLISDSPKRYLSDKMNIFDGSVVIISQVELWALSGSKGLSAFRTVRIFRTFRVLRVTRLLRSLEFMRTIINVVARCIDSLIYIGFLLLLLNVIYSLIGIQIFSGKLDNDSIGIRQNFDNFNDAFLTVYQLMTVENWNDILTVTLLSDVGASLTCLYLISWIFLGNYVFLNLILAILLEAFSEEWENQKLMNDDDDFEDFDEKEKERIRKEQIEKEQEIRIMAMEADDLERELLAKTRKPHEKPLYEGVSCGNSLFIFPKSNPFRKACYRIVHSNYFENFILFLIILSSFKLAIDTYMSDDDEDVLIFSTYIDNFFNGLFGMECILKLISFGFFMDNGSYLRDNWNILDFIIVCSSIVDMSVASINLPFIKILRLLRTLRPLRFISHNLNMKIVVTALLESAGPIANVSIVVLLIFLMFSIFGMSMLQDRFGYCDYEYSYGVQYNVNIDQCKEIGGVWSNKEDNFDNIFRAMLSIFIISTQENWPILMYDGIDSNTSDIGPAKNSMPLIAYFYLICVFVCNIFLINLFVGVIFMNFIEATNSTNPYHSIFLTPEQERWLDFQKMIASAKTDFTSYLLPKNKYRIKINDIINHQKFEIFIMTCIVLNIVTMALTYEGSPASYDTVLENINYFFTSVFILECIMKFVGLGVRAFWYSGWNRFDLFVVISSIIDILMSTIGTSLFSFLRVGPQLARILRVMRVSRLLKLIKSLKGIQKLLETLSLALPSLLNVGALLMLAYFIFAVLGVFLFKDIKKGKIIDEYNNFGNFHNAMILLFSCSTGESWWSFMFDTLKETPYAPLYWIPFIVMCSFIMLNLFILVILDEFEKYNKKGDSPSSLFKEGVVEFRKNWSALTRNTKGTRMPSRLLIDFFKLLNPELGFGPAARRELVAKEIMKMNITGDENNNVYFNEVLFGALKRTYGNLEMTKIGREIKKIRLNPNTQKLITQEEIMTKKKIEKGKNEIIRKDFRALRRLARANTKRTNNINNQISSFKTIEMKSSNSLLDDSKLFQSKPSTRKKKKSTLNPLVTILFVGMSFKSWLKFTRLVQKDEIENDWNFQDDISSDDDMSHKSDSVFNEDEFNEEEQKEYDYKTNLPKKPKKNILEYEKSVDSGINDSGTDEEINKRNNDENNDRILVCDENYKNDQEKTLQKPILKNNKMSAFAALQENQFDNRISLKGKELEELKINNIASEEKDVIYSEGN